MVITLKISLICLFEKENPPSRIMVIFNSHCIFISFNFYIIELDLIKRLILDIIFEKIYSEFKNPLFVCHIH